MRWVNTDGFIEFFSSESIGNDSTIFQCSISILFLGQCFSIGSMQTIFHSF